MQGGFLVPAKIVCANIKRAEQCRIIYYAYYSPHRALYSGRSPRHKNCFQRYAGYINTMRRISFLLRENFESIIVLELYLLRLRPVIMTIHERNRRGRNVMKIRDPLIRIRI